MNRTYDFLKNFVITYQEGIEGSFYEEEFIFEAKGVTPMHVTPPEMIELLNGLIEVQKLIKSDDIIETYVKKLNEDPVKNTGKILYATKIGYKVKIQLLDYDKNVQVHKFQFDAVHDNVFDLSVYVMRLLNHSIALYLKI